MNTTPRRRAALTLVCALLGAGAAIAHGDDDHGAPAGLLPQTLLPRTSTATEDFELVALLEGNRLLIHLDRADNNQPVPKARLEVEGAGPAALAAEVAPGLYALNLAQPLAAGAHGLTFTVQTADGADLMTATLDVPAAPATTAAEGAGTTLQRLQPWLGGAALLLVGGLAGFALRGRNPLSKDTA